MQDRYAGDYGDYVKFALLRHLSLGRKLGVAWYLFPDEGHNSDGKHVSYLAKPEEWRHLDPDLFDKLSNVVANERSVAALQRMGVVDATFFAERLISAKLPANERSEWRSGWFCRVLASLEYCDLVFADPDNAIKDDAPDRRREKEFGKQIPLSEVRALSNGRTAIIYFHNTHFKGGHDAEVDHWCGVLGPKTLAVRSKRFNGRTFFILNPDAVMAERVRNFCHLWSKHGVELHH